MELKVKFGVHIEPQLGHSYKQAEKIALEGEKLGYDSFWCSDHFFLNNKSEKRYCLEAWTLLSALAAKTSEIRLGTLVTCNSYRHPSLLAKIASTIDMISNGRLYFGFGAGWKKIEYNAYGYPFPPLKERFDRMEEALQVIRLLWTEDKPSFEGEYYTIKNAFSAPKPIQKPTPPIFIGGDGEKRTLKAVAKYADYCNLFVKPEVPHKLEVLRKHCQDVGRDYNDVGKSLFVINEVFVTESEDELEEFLAYMAKEFEKPVDEIRKQYDDDEPGSWIGHPDEVKKKFQYYIDMGFDFFQVIFPGLGDDYVDASRRFAEGVMKKL
ncbi:MAG: LLM class F420-dependent oxidoreductase [Candidatus Thorarchaeota archaeon]|jgi:F420-dependent oxidoreductase-like protein